MDYGKYREWEGGGGGGVMGNIESLGDYGKYREWGIMGNIESGGLWEI